MQLDPVADHERSVKLGCAFMLGPEHGNEHRIAVQGPGANRFRDRDHAMRNQLDEPRSFLKAIAIQEDASPTALLAKVPAGPAYGRAAPDCMGEIPATRPGRREIPVDQSYRPLIGVKQVVRRDVVMAHHLMRLRCAGKQPPVGIWRRNELQRAVMKLAYQCAGRGEAVVFEHPSWRRHLECLTGDDGKDFPSPVVDAKRRRDTIDTALSEMPEKSMDGRCPWTACPAHGIADAACPGDVPAKRISVWIHAT